MEKETKRKSLIETLEKASPSKIVKKLANKETLKSLAKKAIPYTLFPGISGAMAAAKKGIKKGKEILKKDK